MKKLPRVRVVGRPRVPQLEQMNVLSADELDSEKEPRFQDR